MFTSVGPVLLLAVLVYILDLHPRVAAANLRSSARNDLAIRADNTSISLLDVLEVDPPVLTPSSASCEQTLMDYVFAYSYGEPFVGSYVPPACDFNRVTFNLTVTSRGRQYDRLALMYFNDTEIFRTSTAEPTTNGIIWTYIKDMSAYLPLFKEPQKIIFDLGNLITDVYTGTFNTTLIASFYKDDESTFTAADLILPVSAGKSSSDSASAFNFPTENASSTLTLPQNIDHAIFSISANGQSAEEFWWSNVPSSDVDAFANVTTLYGYSPWREVQLYLDGTLAGVAWPFPVIFTGGVVPGFWRPIVGIDAFDLKEDQIDITPWLPLLCDGTAHTFEIRVTGLNDTGTGSASLSETVGSYWVLTGKIFIWLSGDNGTTTGSAPSISAPDPSIVLSSVAGGKLANGTNTTLDYSVSVQRQFSVAATVITSAGSKEAAWSQTLSFSNIGNFTDEGNVQVTTQTTHGLDSASGGGPSNGTTTYPNASADSYSYERTYAYPLWCYTAYAEQGTNFTIVGAIDRGKTVETLGASAFPLGLADYNDYNATLAASTGTLLHDRQNGTATYLSVASPSSQSYGSGTTEQDLGFFGVTNGADDLLYHRHILAVNGSIVSNAVELEGREEVAATTEDVVAAQQQTVMMGGRQAGYQEYAWEGPPIGGAKTKNKRGKEGLLVLGSS